MKLFIFLAVSTALAVSGCSQGVTQESAPALGAFSDTPAEIGCGMCIYDMSGVNECKLAAIIDGKPMLVTGVDVDLHDHGLCTASKEAVVTGKVEGDIVVATKVDIG